MADVELWQVIKREPPEVLAVNAVTMHIRDRECRVLVFQDYALYPHMTVRENLAFGLKMRKTARSIVTRRVQEAA